MPRHATQSRDPHDVVIPDKLYFRIGEVAKLCGVETYVLRFWETEFPQLRPNKSGTGQRLYRKREVELALRVRRLLHDEGYTIAGARQILSHESGKGKAPQLPLLERGHPERAAPETSAATVARIQQLRAEMRELLGILSSAPSRTAARIPRSERKLRAVDRPNLFE
jgi:DNA-binding transcriptional MerR regulator